MMHNCKRCGQQFKWDKHYRNHIQRINLCKEFKNNMNNMNNYLKCTNESQGHGKSWETDILCCMGFSHNILNNYKHNERYDGKKEHSPDNRNKSIKTTGKFAPDCGDILRCLYSENTDIVIICYNQEGNYKIVEKTIQINPNSPIAFSNLGMYIKG